MHFHAEICLSNAAVNRHLELTLLKGRQRFNAITTSNLEMCKIFGLVNLHKNLLQNLSCNN